MKKLLCIFSVILFAGIGFIACSSDDNDDDTVIDYNNLPQVAKGFVATHFPGVTSNYAKKENTPDLNGSLYEVHLTNGFEIDFDIDGNWTEINGNYQLIPESILLLIPQNILDYCSVNYPNAGIIEIDKKPYGYKIDLNNTIDLRFDVEGNFLSIDR